MSEFEATRRMPAATDQVFAVAADVERLQEWLPTVERAVPVQDEDAAPATTRVRVEGDGSAGHYATEGFWRPSHEQLRIEWGTPSRGASGGNYAGWLQVHDVGSTDDARSSDVTIHLSFFDGAPDDVDASLHRALDTLADLVSR